MKRLLFLMLITALAVFFLGCPKTTPNSPNLRSNNRYTAQSDECRRRPSNEVSERQLSVAGEPCALVSRTHSGETPLDRDILFCQRDLLASRQPEMLLEKLGWLYVEKARRSFDPGFYTLAEQCADCLE